MDQLRSLVAQHGWGNVPASRVAAAVEPEWLYPASLVALILGGVAFLMLVYQSSKTLHEIGTNDLKWSPGWTAASLVIPIVNLYRPWVGLNELDRTLVCVTQRQRFAQYGNMEAKREFGLPTLIYALAFFMLQIVGTIIGNIGKSFSRADPRNQAEFYQFAANLENFLIFSMVSTVVMLLVHYIYWNRMEKNMRGAAAIFWVT